MGRGLPRDHQAQTDRNKSGERPHFFFATGFAGVFPLPVPEVKVWPVVVPALVGLTRTVQFWTLVEFVVIWTMEPTVPEVTTAQSPVAVGAAVARLPEVHLR